MLGALLAASAVACSASTPAATVVPSPFPDVALGAVDDFGTDGVVVELIAPVDLLVVGSTPDPVVFVRKDPNNGCRLALATDLDPAGGERFEPDAVFVDMCHGNQYDIAGRPLVGAEPMTTLPTAVRDGELVWTRDDVRSAAEQAVRADD